MGKIYTLQEANQVLPLIKSITASIIETWGDILATRNKMEDHEQKKELVPDELKEEINRHIDRINGYIKEVEELGCFVEEFRRGVINIPSLMFNRKVFLTWCMGEDKVGHFHELDETHMHRRAVSKEVA